MKIGNLELNGVAALAPMAGATDRSFRAKARQWMQESRKRWNILPKK